MGRFGGEGCTQCVGYIIQLLEEEVGDARGGGGKCFFL